MFTKKLTNRHSKTKDKYLKENMKIRNKRCYYSKLYAVVNCISILHFYGLII